MPQVLATYECVIFFLQLPHWNILIKYYFYYNIIETIEHILIYSLSGQAFNDNMFCPLLEAGDKKVNKT